MATLESNNAINPSWRVFNSLNTLVNNTKSVSESFFDNVTASLAKKTNEIAKAAPPGARTLDNTETAIVGPSDVHCDAIIMPSALDGERVIAMEQSMARMQREIERYKQEIDGYQHNETECMRIFTANMHRYVSDTQQLQQRIEWQSRQFHAQLSSIAIKAGLDENEVFSVCMRTDEIERIYNAEPAEDDDDEDDLDLDTANVIMTTHTPIANPCNCAENSLQQSARIKELELSLDEYRNRYLQLIASHHELEQKGRDLEEINNGTNAVCHELSEKLTQTTSELLQQQQRCSELEATYAATAEANADITGENALLRQQLNESKTSHVAHVRETETLRADYERVQQALTALQATHADSSQKLEEECAVRDQLAEQLKKMSKAGNKRQKSNAKLKKKLDALQMQFDEQQQQLTKLHTKEKEFESNERRYFEGIEKYKTIQRETAQQIEQNVELQRKNGELENQGSVMQQHCDELRKQCKRDTQNISRLTTCNGELVAIVEQSENILVESAHKYLPIAILNDDELELTDSERDEDGNGEEDDKDGERKKAVVYFEDDSESEENVASAEDEICKLDKEKDTKALQCAARLKIQISMLAEQLHKFKQDIGELKHEVHRREEIAVRQQQQLRQILCAQHAHAQLISKKEKNEKSVVSMPSMRGVTLRRPTSSVERDSSAHAPRHNQRSRTPNNMNANSTNMNPFTASNPFSPSLSPSQSANELFLFDTQSQHSVSSVNSISRKSVKSQSAMSLNAAADCRKKQNSPIIGKWLNL